MSDRKTKKISKAFMFLLLSVFLIVMWYKDALLIATGEMGLSLFNPKITLSLYSSMWVEHGFGFFLPFYLPRLTFFLIASVLNFIVPNWMAQAILFWIAMFVGMVGMYLLTGEVLGKKHERIRFFSSLFYSLNLYTQTQVWDRFLYTDIYAWAYLPLFLFLFFKWIRKKKFKWLLAFLVSSLFFSNTFGHPAYLLTYWVTLAMLILVEIFKNRKNLKAVYKILTLTLFASFLWVVVNSWWLYPYWVVTSYKLYVPFSRDYNLNSLVGVSKYFPTYQILSLRQGFVLGDSRFQADHVGLPLPYGGWYNHSWVWGISILVFLIVLIGISMSRKTKHWSYLVGLFVIGWFVSKGANPPLGFPFFKFLFSTFPFTAVLRNPYAKFGLVFVLPYSIFFALGLNWLYETLRPKLREFVVSSVLILSCGVLVWPMWTGDIYKDRRIEVPLYYEEANEFLKQFGGDGRILMLPLIPGDSVKTKWGYQGVEPSGFLFSRSTISRIVRVNYYDEAYWNLYRDLNERMVLDSDKLRNFNVSFVIFRRDLEKGLSDKGLSPEDIEKVVLQNSDLEYLATFGDLEIYSFEPNKQGLIFDVDSDKEINFSYQKLSPTRYKVYIKGADQPFNLIFKSTFNDLWEARIDKEKLDKHFLVYKYANGWLVDKKGDYTIDIVFKVWPWE